MWQQQQQQQQQLLHEAATTAAAAAANYSPNLLFPHRPQFAFLFRPHQPPTSSHHLKLLLLFSSALAGDDVMSDEVVRTFSLLHFSPRVFGISKLTTMRQVDQTIFFTSTFPSW